MYTQGSAQITVVNRTDCNITLTLTCGGKSVSSNNYTDNWWGTWSLPRTHTFDLPCCSNPNITIVFDPVYGVGTVSGSASTLNGTITGCYSVTNCLPKNAAFKILWDASTCTLTLDRPAPGCN